MLSEMGNKEMGNKGMKRKFSVIAKERNGDKKKKMIQWKNYVENFASLSSEK